MAWRPGLPPGWGVELDRRTRRPRPGLVIGGHPTRALRLTPSGSRTLDRLADGSPPDRGAEGRLARRLVDLGLAHPRPAASAATEGSTPDLTVVVPVRDRADGLSRTLAALGPETTVVVVDDGSVEPADVLAHAPGTTVVRRDRSGGPAAARNTGWRTCTTELIAFVDADVELEASTLTRLAHHLADQAVAAVAPRVTTADEPTVPRWLAAYDGARSPLDLGPWPAPVRPDSSVAYVPTTTLVVRRAALEAVGGFDEALHTGEDVDLVWRLIADGWRVRYQPDTSAAHPPRGTLIGLVRQRYGYGCAAGPLARRHGDAVAPLVLTPPAALLVLATLRGSPRAVAGVSAATVATLLARPRGMPRTSIARLGLLSQLRTLRIGAEALRRPWWPLAVALAAIAPSTRRPLAAALVVPPLVTWVRRRPALDPVRFVALHLVDDASYGAGVWRGALRARTAVPLLPAVQLPATLRRWRRQAPSSAAPPGGTPPG